MSKNNKVRKGFTLTEVLITLAIVGVVAALTIPTMITNAKHEQNLARLKKAYQNFAQVYDRVTKEYGAIEYATATCSSNSDHNCLRNLLKPYFSYRAECDDEQSYGKCHPDPAYNKDGAQASGSWRENEAGLVLNDGSLLMIQLYKKACDENWAGVGDECGWINLDINGLKGPNRYGDDLFLFVISRNGILPFKNENCTTDGRRCAQEYIYN